MATTHDTRETGLEDVLERLLARNPGARVAAFDDSRAGVPLPDSVPLTGHVVLEGAEQPGAIGEVSDRPAIDAGWAEMLGAGVSRRRVRPRDGGHPLDLYLVDARSRHGVVVAICVDAPFEQRGATSGPPPRVCRITKDYSALNLSVDPAVTAMLGWLPEEMTDRRTLEFLHPDDRQGAIDAWMDMLADPGAPSRSRVRHITKDGAYRWVEINNTNRLDEPGVGVVECDLVDITDEMEAAEALRRTEQQFAKATAIAHVGGWELDPLTRTLAWSAETYRISGLDPATPPPSWEGFVALVPDEAERARLDQALGRAIDTCRGFSLEHRLARPDGDVRIVRTEARVDALMGTASLVVGMIQDVTDQRRAAEERALLEQRVQEALRLESLGVLAGGIAHDFNNLLAVILGYASLGLEIAADPEVADHLRQIEVAARRGAELTDQLLTYAGRSMREVVPVDVARTMLETVKLLSVSMPRGARLQTRHDGPAVVEGDPAQIRQIVMNLVTNGVEALEDRGTVVARTFTTHLDRAGAASLRIAAAAGPGRYVCLEVVDDGSGLPPDVIGRIFEPFYSTRFTGRGLGLPAVLGVVLGHRGGIDIVTAPDEGTTFRVYLPASDRRSIEEPLVTHPRVARGTGTLLVVDDDLQIRALATAVLRGAGFDIVTAAGGHEASAILESRRDIAAVLLDMAMDDVDGDTVLEQLRASNNTVPVVVVTGLPAAEAAARVAHHGATVVSKPYAPAVLVDAVIAAIGRPPAS